MQFYNRFTQRDSSKKKGKKRVKKNRQKVYWTLGRKKLKEFEEYIILMSIIIQI